MPRMRGAGQLRLLVLGAVMVGAGLPAAAQDPGAALVAQLRGLPVPEGWTMQEQGDATVLRNASGLQPSHMVFYRPAPSGELIRSTLMVAGITSDDPEAHIGVMLINGEGLCMLVLFARGGDAELSCSVGEKFTPIGSLKGVLKLDGSDRIQLLELGQEAIFHVNRQEIGRIADHPALEGDFGLVFTGRGDFAINTFSVAHMTDEDLFGPSAAPGTPQPTQTGPTPTEPPVVVDVPPPQQPPGKWTTPASDIPPVPPRAGWQDRADGSGVILINDDIQGDERIVPLNLPPLQGAERLTELDVSIGPTASGQQSLRASGGLLLENLEQGQSCGLQITAAGDGLLLCYASDGRGIEVGRQAGVATGAGPHRLSILERGDALSAMINGTVIGTLKSHPVIGGEMSLIAWDRGSFAFSALQAQAQSQSRPAAPSPARLEPRPAGSLGDHLKGPLPLFGADQPRADAAYLGIAKSILMHELGHALIGELGVPATGPEEDAVDIYAALHLAETVAQSSGDRALANDTASYASLLWYYSGRLEEQQNIPASEGWQDEHTGGLKRFRNMFCVIYGADPRGFSRLAEAVGLEERTLARCEDEFLKQNRAWRAILSPYARLSPAMPEGRLPATAAGAEISVEFQPSNRQIGEYVRQNYQAELTRVAQALGQAYVLPRMVKVVFQDCDAVNAWYYPKEGSVTMCYDIIEHFIVMTSDIELATQGGYSAAELGQAAAPQGMGGSQGAAGQGTAAQVDAAREELTDFGIPASLQFFAPPFRGPTPVANPQARTITTPEVKALIDAVPDVMILDIREGVGLQSLPGAWQLAGAGRDGSLQDSLQVRLGSVLADMAGSDKGRAIIVLGEGPEDRAAWNAALRIGQEGYATSWYRGGVSAWRAAGHALSALQ